MAPQKRTEGYRPFGPHAKSWATREKYMKELSDFVARHDWLDVEKAVRAWYIQPNHAGPSYFYRAKMAAHGPFPEPFFSDLMAVQLHKRLTKAVAPNVRPVKKAVRKISPRRSTRRNK